MAIDYDFPKDHEAVRKSAWMRLEYPWALQGRGIAFTAIRFTAVTPPFTRFWRSADAYNIVFRWSRTCAPQRDTLLP